MVEIARRAQHAVQRTASGLDGVWTSLVVALIVLWLVWPSQAAETVQFTAESLLAMSPIALAAIALAGAVRAIGADGLMARVFRGRVGWTVLAASLFGALTPVCGIGVVPIISALLAAGVPLAPVMAFWLSSPITDPAMLAITAGALGLPFAIGKTVAAGAIGVLGGLATCLVQARGGFGTPLRAHVLGDRDAARCCAQGDGLQVRFWRDGERRAVFRSETVAAARLMAKWLTLAFVLESLMMALVPPGDVAAAVGSQAGWAIPLAVLVGMPLYVDGYAALPLVRGLVDLGMSPGAAMAFLVAGAITSAYASVAVFSLVRWPVFCWYLALAAVGSLVAGYGFALFT